LIAIKEPRPKASKTAIVPSVPARPMHNVLDAVTGALEAHAVSITTRKGQKLSLAAQSREVLYIVRKGIFLARAPITQGRYQVLGLLYPGDIVRPQAMLPIEGTEVACASETGEAWRLPWAAVRDLLDSGGDVSRVIADRLADQTARATLHGAVMTALTGDERVAALLIELALRTGKRTATGIMFEMPLSRIDIAEHLALNPDTVSRIVSRMRRAGTLAPAGRNRLVCPSFEALAAACPLTSAVSRIHKGAASATVKTI
jgi:CRP/FNR family transcriptional regulator